LGWRPLTPDNRDELVGLAASLGDALAGVPDGDWDPSLADGHAGVALFYGFLSVATGRTADAERARGHRDRSIAGLATEPLGPSLWAGYPGVAWAVELVDRHVEVAAEDRNEAVDSALAEMLARPAIWSLPHDLVTGVTGVGLYLLSRLPGTGARCSLELVLDRLEDAAIVDEAGLVHWWTPADELIEQVAKEYPSGVGDLGVAHGVPGPIGLLGLMVEAGVGGERARTLLDGSVRWAWAHALSEPAGPSFPAWMSPDEPERTPARSAWCYGDPGVAVVLLRAARVLGDAALAEAAVALARRAALRPPEETGVEDACVCHGSAGLALLFHRLYLATDEDVLRGAARYWLADTVRRCRSAVRSGDPAWVLGDEDGPHWTGADITDGAAGVGLVLLAAATDIDPAWDRMFALS
jgi:lantibiotic biosynthesis protein